MAKNEKPGTKYVIKRFNVLYLMTAAYGSLLILFTVLAISKDITSAEAWNMLEAPLMALIGGTLAISKDLIGGDETASSTENPNNLNNTPNHSKKYGETREKDE